MHHASPGEVFGAFVAGLVIGAFAHHAFILWRRIERDRKLLDHYGLPSEQWDAMAPHERAAARAAYARRAELDRG